MNIESEKSFIIGMLVGLAGSFKHQFTLEQSQTYMTILDRINKLYYPKKETGK